MTTLPSTGIALSKEAYADVITNINKSLDMVPAALAGGKSMKEAASAQVWATYVSIMPHLARLPSLAKRESDKKAIKSLLTSVYAGRDDKLVKSATSFVKRLVDNAVWIIREGNSHYQGFASLCRGGDQVKIADHLKMMTLGRKTGFSSQADILKARSDAPDPWNVKVASKAAALVKDGEEDAVILAFQALTDLLVSQGFLTCEYDLTSIADIGDGPDTSDAEA